MLVIRVGLRSFELLDEEFRQRNYPHRAFGLWLGHNNLGLAHIVGVKICNSLNRS